MAKLDLNVASRPFVNERPLNSTLAVIILLLGGLTFANLYAMFDARVRSQRAARLRVASAESVLLVRNATAELKQRISPKRARAIRSSARSVGAIIRSRQLSWSRLLDQLAAVLPDDVRIASITPSVDFDADGRIQVVMECVAGDHGSKLSFYQRLYQTPFADALILSEMTAERGAILFGIRCLYDPEAPDVVPGDDSDDAAGGPSSRRAAGAVPASGEGLPSANLSPGGSR